MQNRALEFWVGIFTILGIGLALYMIYRTGDLRLRKQEGYAVHVSFADVSGLDTGDTVRLAGVEVGSVAAIELLEDRARVTLDIDHGVALYEDATASVQSYGLLGDRFVSVEPGHARLPRVGPDGTIHPAVAEDSLNVVMGKLSSVAGDVQAVTENLRRVFGGEEGEASLRQILLNTRDLSQQLMEIAEENRRQFREITLHLAGLTGEIEGMVVENREAIRKTVSSLPETADNLRAITGETRSLLEEHRGDLARALAQIGEASVRLDASLENVEEITRQIRAGEGTLGKFIYDEELYEEARSTLREARNLVEDLREQAPISAFIAVGGLAF